MAIYRLEKKSISRGNGHNLCAAIGYRAGLKITDHNPKNTDAKTHDYSKKSDVAHSEIILTDELKNAGVRLDFEQIANLVEQGETTKRGKMKKSAKLASEYVLAGSHELSLDENIQAFREFAEQQSKEQGVIAMVFVHDPKLGNDVRASKDAGDSTRHHDPRNIHAHIVVLSRQVDLTSSGRLELGNKSDSELSDTARAEKSLPPSRQWLKGVREQWANIQNKSLELHNIAPVTHKSYKDLGLNYKPTIHLGKHAHAMEQKGIRTRIGDYNESINKRNSTHLELTTVAFADFAEQATDYSKQATTGSQRAVERAERRTSNAIQAVNGVIRYERERLETDNRYTERTDNKIKDIEQRIDDNERRVNDTKQRIDDSKQHTASTDSRIDKTDSRIDQVERTVARADSAINKLLEPKAIDAALYYCKAHIALKYQSHSGSIGEKSKIIADTFDSRQKSIINDFAKNYNLQLTDPNKTKIFDFKTQEFFKNNIYKSDVRKFAEMLADPKSERLEYSKTLSDERQQVSTEKTNIHTLDMSKTSQRANLDVSDDYEPPSPF